MTNRAIFKLQLTLSYGYFTGVLILYLNIGGGYFLALQLVFSGPGRDQLSC